jgi:hypothetical protein
MLVYMFFEILAITQLNSSPVKLELLQKNLENEAEQIQKPLEQKVHTENLLSNEQLQRNIQTSRKMDNEHYQNMIETGSIGFGIVTLLLMNLNGKIKRNEEDR